MKYNLYEIGMKYGQNKQKISGVSWVGFFEAELDPDSIIFCSYLSLASLVTFAIHLIFTILEP